MLFNFFFVLDVFQDAQSVNKENALFTDSHVLKNGDIVYITAYIDLYNIYVRKVDDDSELQQLNEKVNDCCSLSMFSFNYISLEKNTIFCFVTFD